MVSLFGALLDFLTSLIVLYPIYTTYKIISRKPAASRSLNKIFWLTALLIPLSIYYLLKAISVLVGIKILPIEDSPEESIIEAIVVILAFIGVGNYIKWFYLTFIEPITSKKQQKAIKSSGVGKRNS